MRWREKGHDQDQDLSECVWLRTPLHERDNAGNVRSISLLRLLEQHLSYHMTTGGIA